MLDKTKIPTTFAARSYQLVIAVCRAKEVGNRGRVKHWRDPNLLSIPGAFDAIINSLLRLQVSGVEALPLLLRIGQIKTRAWPD